MGPVYSRNMSLVRAAILEDTILIIFLVETCLNYRNVFMTRIFGPKRSKTSLSFPPSCR